MLVSFGARALFLTLIVILVPLLPSARDVTQERPPAPNGEVIVRVLAGGKPVAGLPRDDFKLFLNDKESTINGFAEIRKNISPKTAAGQGTETTPGRLFLLLFNVSNHPLPIAKEIGILFKEIIRPGDRLMVMTNNYFLNDRTVSVPRTEREKLEAILKLEERTIRTQYGILEQKLDSRTSELLNCFRTADSDDLTPEDVLNRLEVYHQNYAQCQREFRSGFLDPTLRQYEKVAGYLRGQDVRKWALAFFQEGTFPRLFYRSELQAIIRRFQTYFETASDSSTVKPDRMMSNARFVGIRIGQLFEDAKREIEQRSNIHDVEIARKLFIASDATFHMQIISSVGPAGRKGYESIPVSGNAQNTLRLISQATGGQLIRSQKLEDFIKEVTASEDVSYRLSYEPQEGSAGDPEIDVKVTGPAYTLIFADKGPPPRRNPQMSEASGDSHIPEIGLSDVTFGSNTLAFSVSGIRLVPVESIPKGRIELQIKILDRNGNVVENRSRIFNVKQDRIAFALNVPQIRKRRKYDIVITATDLNSDRNDIFIRNVDGEE